VRPARFGPTGDTADIEINIYIDDLDRGRLLGQHVRDRISRIPGVRDVSYNLEETSPEIRVVLDRPRLAHLGTNPGVVTSTVSTYFMGTVAGVFQEGNDEYDILVRAPGAVRVDLDRAERSKQEVMKREN